MASRAETIAEEPMISIISGVFALLALGAWLASLSGVAIALVYYSAVLISERICSQLRSPRTRRHRAWRIAGLAFIWLVTLAFSALVLPSNFSVALI